MTIETMGTIHRSAPGHVVTCSLWICITDTKNMPGHVIACFLSCYQPIGADSALVILPVLLR
jgi:hypothetical protein